MTERIKMLNELKDYCLSCEGCENCVLNKDIWCGDDFDQASNWTDEEIESSYKILKALTNDTPSVQSEVDHPDHYNQGNMECIDEMILIFGTEAVINFCLCNAWKYRSRALYKGKETDMQKSFWYMNKAKELSDGYFQI